MPAGLRSRKPEPQREAKLSRRVGEVERATAEAEEFARRVTERAARLHRAQPHLSLREALALAFDTVRDRSIGRITITR